LTKPLEVLNSIFNELENCKKEKEAEIELILNLAPITD